MSAPPFCDVGDLVAPYSCRCPREMGTPQFGDPRPHIPSDMGTGGEHITRDMGPWGPKNTGDMGIRR